jgi:methylated-DNA-[protein]-cysteine S-methyltransferase
MTAYYHVLDTPVGPFSLAVNEAGAVLATAFGGLASLQSRCPVAHWELDPARTRNATLQVTEYFAGQRQSFDLPLAPLGTAYQNQVWAALAQIPFGQTRTYGEIAQPLQSGPRAVGNANGANPIALIVPCHRVIGAKGTLTGFAFGAEIKQRLLEHEGSWPLAAAPPSRQPELALF